MVLGNQEAPPIHQAEPTENSRLTSISEVLAAHPELDFSVEQLEELVANGQVGGVLSGADWLTSFDFVAQYVKEKGQ